MPDFRDLFPDHEEQAPLWYAIIAEDVTDLADEVPVIIPDFDPNLQWGPCKWQQRGVADMPEKGNVCLVAFDNRRDPWIISWWPF